MYTTLRHPETIVVDDLECLFLSDPTHNAILRSVNETQAINNKVTLEPSTGITHHHHRPQQQRTETNSEHLRRLWEYTLQNRVTGTTEPPFLPPLGCSSPFIPFMRLAGHLTFRFLRAWCTKHCRPGRHAIN